MLHNHIWNALYTPLKMTFLTVRLIDWLIYLVKQCQQDTNSLWLDMHLDNIHLDNKTEIFITIWLDNN